MSGMLGMLFSLFYLRPREFGKMVLTLVMGLLRKEGIRTNRSNPTMYYSLETTLLAGAFPFLRLPAPEFPGPERLEKFHAKEDTNCIRKHYQ